ncbi:hypothetical protein MMC25_006867 [Agyrium rufum]|nr:hypothetical protein [Agyrium rufum]
MAAVRPVQSSLLRLIRTSATPSLLQRGLVCQFASPSAIATSRYRLQTRSESTAHIKPSEAYSILEQQRLKRPVAPHLAIYRPQITWYLSGLNRITGCVVSGGFYIFGFGYLVAPLFGAHWSSTAMAASVATWPVALKVGTKLLIALPFTFHSWNGLRHLFWDSGANFGNRQVIWTGWTVVGLTFLSSAWLAFMM